MKKYILSARREGLMVVPTQAAPEIACFGVRILLVPTQISVYISVKNVWPKLSDKAFALNVFR